MIPRYYDPAPYQDVVEHCRKYLDARLKAIEAKLKTIREESEQPTEFVIFKDSAMIKEWEVRRKRSDETYRPK